MIYTACVNQEVREYMRHIAQTVTDYAEAHGYAHPKSVEEIVEDLEFCYEYGCPEEVLYLYEYIDYDGGDVWDLVASFCRAVP